jgi:NAD(P)-dependent dehydrogenase (short-subunit alcohol dehydrogenase family)
MYYLVHGTIKFFKIQVEEIRQSGGEAEAAQCDVRDDSAQQAVFEAHHRRFGRLDIAILNAGIFEKGDLPLPRPVF